MEFYDAVYGGDGDDDGDSDDLSDSENMILLL